MRCDRCGDRLEEYTLNGASAVVCASCGFINVPVDHSAEPRPNESWQDAFERFYDRFGAPVEEASDDAAGAVPVPAPPGEAEALTDLAGIGPAVARRLEAAGIESVPDLAAAAPEDLETIEGIGPKLAARLIAQLNADASAAQ